MESRPLAKAPGYSFYGPLSKLLDEDGFDSWVEGKRPGDPTLRDAPSRVLRPRARFNDSADTTSILALLPRLAEATGEQAAGGPHLSRPTLQGQ